MPLDGEQLRRRVLRALDGYELDEAVKQDVARLVADFLVPDIRSAYRDRDTLESLRKELDRRFPEVSEDLKRGWSGADNW